MFENSLIKPRRNKITPNMNKCWGIYCLFTYFQLSYRANKLILHGLVLLICPTIHMLSRPWMLECPRVSDVTVFPLWKRLLTLKKKCRGCLWRWITVGMSVGWVGGGAVTSTRGESEWTAHEPRPLCPRERGIYFRRPHLRQSQPLWRIVFV